MFGLYQSKVQFFDHDFRVDFDGHRSLQQHLQRDRHNEDAYERRHHSDEQRKRHLWAERTEALILQTEIVFMAIVRI